MDAYDLDYPQQPEPAIPDSQATIVVSNLPPTLSDKLKRKVVIDLTNGYESITSIRPVRDKLIINIENHNNYRYSFTCTKLKAIASRNLPETN